MGSKLKTQVFCIFHKLIQFNSFSFFLQNPLSLYNCSINYQKIFKSCVCFEKNISDRTFNFKQKYVVINRKGIVLNPYMLKKQETFISTS